MSRGRKKYKPDLYASSGIDDKFAMVYDGLYRSRQFLALDLGTRHFYTICRIQAKSKQGTSCLYNHGKEDGETYSENDFVFPAKHMKIYGYDRSNGKRYLEKLIEAGFITKKEQNNHRKKVNVYSFSAEWKNR